MSFFAILGIIVIALVAVAFIGAILWFLAGGRRGPSHGGLSFRRRR